MGVTREWLTVFVWYAVCGLNVGVMIMYFALSDEAVRKSSLPRYALVFIALCVVAWPYFGWVTVYRNLPRAIRELREYWGKAR